MLPWLLEIIRQERRESKREGYRGRKGGGNVPCQ